MAKQIEKTILINAPTSIVWENLTNPLRMKQWMGEPEMQIEINTDWKVGSSIIINGFHHLPFKNKGIVFKVEPNKILQYNHLSSLSQLPDVKENYSVLTFSLNDKHKQTALTLSVVNFPTETIFKHLNLYWKTTAELLKKYIETNKQRNNQTFLK